MGDFGEGARVCRGCGDSWSGSGEIGWGLMAGRGQKKPEPFGAPAF